MYVGRARCNIHITAQHTWWHMKYVVKYVGHLCVVVHPTCNTTPIHITFPHLPSPSPIPKTNKVFLNSSARATNLESSDPDEILFPARVNEIDLGPCVCDALALALPATISCGTSRCLGGATAGVGLDGESSGWRTVPAGAKKEGKRKGKRGAKGGPFSVLAGLKGEG